MRTVMVFALGLASWAVAAPPTESGFSVMATGRVERRVMQFVPFKEGGEWRYWMRVAGSLPNDIEKKFLDRTYSAEEVSRFTQMRDTYVGEPHSHVYRFPRSDGSRSEGDATEVCLRLDRSGTIESFVIMTFGGKEKLVRPHALELVKVKQSLASAHALAKCSFLMRIVSRLTRS